MQIRNCPCCGNSDFEQERILWPALIEEWKLKPKEADYINRQQGLKCTNCGSNLRSMSLAGAVMHCYGYKGYFSEFVRKYKKLDVLELNEAGYLNIYLKTMRKHSLAAYPDVKMENLPYRDNSWDLIVHSDTLEHVEDPIQSLKETLRVLKPGGFTCFTVPIVVGRLTRKRTNKEKPSYHGSPGNDEYLVKTEFGGDVWTMLMDAGFQDCRLFSFDYPASIVVIGVKS